MILKSIFPATLCTALAFAPAVQAQTATEPDAAAEAVAATDETICGLSPASWVNGSAESSDLTGIESALQLDVSGSGPLTRAFRLTAPTTLRIEAAAKQSGDPVLRLYAEGGGLISENDDASGSYNSQILEPLDPGLYCIQADDLRGTADLTLQIAPESAPPLLTSRELACGPETEATTLGGAALEEAIAAQALRASTGADENSYFRFTLTKPASFSLRADGGAGIDPRIALFDAEGRSIAENDDADGLSARLDFQPELAAGSYCLGLRANEAKPGTITLVAETIDVESYKRRAYARGQLVPLTGDYPVETLRFNPTQGEVVLLGAAAQWFRFDLTETSLVGIRTHGTLGGADTMLRLFDAAGELIVENDDQEGNRNARILPHALPPGRYFLALSDHQANASAGGPLRPVSLLAERFIRAPAD